MTDYIRVAIREDAFARRILPIKPVTALDLDRAKEHDHPRRIIEMAQISNAYNVTYLEGAKERYYKGRKHEVIYTQIMSEKFMKPTEEIMTWRTPLKTVVQEDYLKAIQYREDGMFVTAVDEVAVKEGRIGEFAKDAPITPALLVQGLQGLVQKQVPRGPILLCEEDFLELLKLEQTTVGSAVMQDIVVNGFSYTRLLGNTFVRTLKNDVVKPGNIYFFSTPEYLGVFDVLNDVRAYVKQEGPILTFYMWEDIGMLIANTNGIYNLQRKAA